MEEGIAFSKEYFEIGQKYFTGKYHSLNESHAFVNIITEIALKNDDF
jgi:hypothetical protein